jgi:hypothetical protein
MYSFCCDFLVGVYPRKKLIKKIRIFKYNKSFKTVIYRKKKIHKNKNKLTLISVGNISFSVYLPQGYSK